VNAVVGDRGLFPQTRWSLVQRARGELGKKAFGELLEMYWRPLYHFGRCRGLDKDAALDAVQGFMVHLLEKRALVDGLDPNRGRLRSYLKSAFRNYLTNDHHRQHRQKRGGDAVVVELDIESAERWVDVTSPDPEQAYEREWAASIFLQALQQLQREFQGGLRQGPFELVQQYFSQEINDGMDEIAQRHGMSVPQVKSFLHRARKRYRELLLVAISDTLDGTRDVDSVDTQQELTQLQAALAS
jgi:RNA polymerase sigma-70 factor (ECF subfamily)